MVFESAFDFHFSENISVFTHQLFQNGNGKYNNSWLTGLIVLALVVIGRPVFSKILQVSKLRHKKNSKSRGLALLPGPKPFPWRFIGNMLQMPLANDLIPTFFKWCKQYKHCFLVTMFSEDFVVISNVDMAKSILQSNDDGHLKKTELYRLLQGMDGLAFSTGSKWRATRKTIGKVFHYQHLPATTPVFNKHADILLEKLSENNKIPVDLHIANFTVQTSVEAFISNRATCSYVESMDYILNWKRVTEIVLYRTTHPWLALDIFWKRHPQYLDQQNATSNVNLFVENLIKRHLENSASLDATETANLITEMLKQNYSIQDIRNEVISLLMAHETHFLGFYYLLYMLAAHPEHQRKCQFEVDNLFKEKMDNYISNEDLLQLKYLERCLLEALRLFPPVFVFGRKLETELKLSDEIILPAGTNCLVVPIVIQRNPEYYKNPDSFNPDNFLPEKVNKRPSYAYIPFSAGPRQCLGTKASMASIKIAAAKILHKFDVTTPIKFEDVKFAVTNLTTATKQDLDLHFLPRK